MRILLLDINRNGIQIPFTQKRVPIPVVASLIAIFGARTVAAQETNCMMPTGDYAGSCTDIAIKSYLSVDSNIPPTCELTALCPTMFSGLPAVPNDVFLPAGIQLDDVSNNNGTLTHGGKALSGTAASDIAQINLVDHCLPPEGSYEKSCRTVKSPYISNDPNLVNTDFCEAKADCYTLGGKQESSVIYFNIKAKQTLWASAQRLENCDGYLVAGADDKRCQNKDADSIREIAEESGCRRSLVL